MNKMDFPEIESRASVVEQIMKLRKLSLNKDGLLVINFLPRTR